MAFKIKIYAASLILLLLVACNLPAAATPSPAIPSATAAATPSTSPSSPPANSEPLEAILIMQPASGSQITFQTTVQGEADSTFEQNLVLMVVGEDGAQLALQPTTIQSPLGERGAFSAQLPFSVSSQQPGRISVYSTSAMDGGIVHLSSAEVILLPGGSSQLFQSTTTFESIQISAPQNAAQESGGQFQVSGYSEYYFESNLGWMLCGGGGNGPAELLCGTVDNVLASGSITIDSPDIGQPGPFSATISYSVTATTPARLVLYAASPRDGGLIHVSSVALQLNP
ncbi:MAG: hypothetical protein DWG76_01030 [Chloroflexi bacterium]|nr:hypothetical protein [Chloroflexota bacterium]MQC26020.1 hypothetical protein [Chloroflexota bacterium]